MADLHAVLLLHEFQEEPPPGLYPSAPTVCSCGETPGTRPDEGDWAWWVAHVSALAAAPDTLPEHLTSMPAKDRAVWLVIQRVHDASLTDEDPRTPARFADLLPEAQAALVATVTPVVQIINAVARNPEARAT